MQNDKYLLYTYFIAAYVKEHVHENVIDDGMLWSAWVPQQNKER